MVDWLEFIAALTLFMVSHMFPVRPPMRPWLIARLGTKGYFISYSILSLLVLAWLIMAAARAPYVGVLPQWEIFRWAPLVVMPLACLIAVGGMMTQNPLSFGGLGKQPFDPDKPGMLAATRHPLLVAMALWAGAHLLANGDLAHVILFGLFGGFAVMGMMVIDRRKQRVLGQEEWRRLATGTARLNLMGLSWSPLPLVLAGAVFLVLILVHEPVIGFVPLPW
ncbi:NnrU family protein [Sedimentitalea sp. CY04]|uniref:NnrU family protein n=1 Tax=Parasedimentitalea denitrificans TaxID=2211118 RepID=A0ABX0W3U8_9RHOB|nr:NnrU family protein [Sedimentitalea sp. CY04]NIZ59623.1 NnrU family protein [Sedimentitalea sp. CY04]